MSTPLHDAWARLRIAAVVLVAVSAVAVTAPAVTAPAGATTTLPTTVPPETPSVDPDAPAQTPGLPVDAPLRSGYTPEDVAARDVPGPTPSQPPITAAGAVLFDPADGVILAGVDPRTPRPMASTTKIMTVLLALEALETGRVAPTVTVSAAAATTGQLPGVATLGLTEGDVVEFRNVLAADVLRSGNDGAVAIAEHVAGSEAAYVAMMNQRAQILGLEDTAFVDSTGLSDDPAHHATPLDLALLGQEAMSHEDFATWAGAVTMTIEPFGLLENRNEMLTAYPGTTGIKTGYTNLAGLCLVASAERDGRTLYAVVLGSEDRVADTTALFDHGFTDYARPTPLTAIQPAGTYRTGLGDVPLVASDELARTVGGGAAVEVVVRLAPDVAAPIDVGTPLGEAVLVVDSVEVDRTALVADSAVSATADTAGAAVADAVRAFARLAERRQPVSL